MDIIVASVTVEDRGRFSARMTIDGRVTSWDCMHCHHTPRAALACRKKVQADALAYLQGDGFMEQNVDGTENAPRPIVEWSYLVTTEMSPTPMRKAHRWSYDDTAKISGLLG